jgi:hypothetical protein
MRPGHVDARRDTGARHDAAIDDEQSVAHDLRSWKARFEVGHALPVRRAQPSIERTGLA